MDIKRSKRALMAPYELTIRFDAVPPDGHWRIRGMLDAKHSRDRVECAIESAASAPRTAVHQMIDAMFDELAKIERESD